MDHQGSSTPDERYAAAVAALTGAAEVTLGSAEKRGFGSAALQVRGKIFAMLAGGTLVVKLPRRRVDALVAMGVGARFDPRHDGRLMKEWLSVDPASEHDWLALAQEAREFVAAD